MMPPATPEQESASNLRPTLQSQRPASDEELAVRCLLDTAERTALGIWIYPTMWTIVAVFTGVAQRWPLLAWGNVAGLLLMAIVRFTINRNLPQLLVHHRIGAERGFKLLTLAVAAYWGTLTGICIYLAPNEGFAWIMLTLTVAFCAGGNTLFGINSSLRIPFPLVMIGPVVIAQALQHTPDQKIMMGMEIVLTLYLRRSSGIVQKDYWDARLAQRLSAQQARELELASLTDGLTQAHNRMHFDRQYAHEWARQCRHGRPISLMMIDLDHFKHVNDTYGHPFGDACLIEVAKALHAGCGRSTDFLARYGGEEFVVLLAETNAAGARVVADRMLQLVRSIRLERDGQLIPLTCSIGLSSTTPDATKDAASLIHEADQALYRAKHGGRDQVCSSSTISGSSASPLVDQASQVQTTACRQAPRS